ncbi:MAG: hypothetical protein LBI82_06770 [Dysgonamonadaceae bacterium]|jgi:hypothetical protein|nr:hypothetical protein [Dysgonamonadaceae bacterium]
MEHLSVDSIYREIMFLPKFDKEKLYQRMQKDLYNNKKAVVYTTSGKPLTYSEYIEEINVGLRQIENGETLTDNELQKEIDSW